MINLLLIPLFATLNALRGGGYIDRLFCTFCMALSVFAIEICQEIPIDHAMIIFAVTFVGIYVGLVCSWGQYLNILSGNMMYVKEKGTPPIDWIATKICGFPANPQQFIRWCFVAFTFRGLLFYPLFVALAYYNLQALVFGWATAFMGIVYYAARLAPIGYQVRAGEIMYGALLGLLTAYSV